MKQNTYTQYEGVYKLRVGGLLDGRTAFSTSSTGLVDSRIDQKYTLILTILQSAVPRCDIILKVCLFSVRCISHEQVIL